MGAEVCGGVCAPAPLAGGPGGVGGGGVSSSTSSLQQADRYISTFLRRTGGWKQWQRACKAGQEKRSKSTTDFQDRLLNVSARRAGQGR